MKLKTKVEGLGDVVVDARDTEGALHKLTFEESLKWMTEEILKCFLVWEF